MNKIKILVTSNTDLERVTAIAVYVVSGFKFDILLANELINEVNETINLDIEKVKGYLSELQELSNKFRPMTTFDEVVNYVNSMVTLYRLTDIEARIGFLLVKRFSEMLDKPYISFIKNDKDPNLDLRSIANAIYKNSRMGEKNLDESYAYLRIKNLFRRPFHIEGDYLRVTDQQLMLDILSPKLRTVYNDIIAERKKPYTGEIPWT